MVSRDKTLICRECGREFVFTIGEQDFFASRGFTNEPSRCPECRAARKAERGSGGRNFRAGAPRQEREMHTVTCSQCGKEAQVPFQPRGDRPVYCQDCFERQRAYR